MMPQEHSHEHTSHNSEQPKHAHDHRAHAAHGARAEGGWHEKPDPYFRHPGVYTKVTQIMVEVVVV
jgi:hypothetical protein